MLQGYAEFLKKWVRAELTDNQKKLFHLLKLAATPKSDEGSRAIATWDPFEDGLSLFAASKLKKRIEK